MDSRRKATTSPILNSWKEIANYLGKGIRTVQRYELELRLPIRRPAGKPRASVIATTAELDAWVKASPLRSTFTLRRLPENRAAALVGFRLVLGDHHRLREEMTKCRLELHEAVALIHATILDITARRLDEPRGRGDDPLPAENGRRRIN